MGIYAENTDQVVIVGVEGKLFELEEFGYVDCHFNSPFLFYQQ